jgi:hypothetical protein
VQGVAGARLECVGGLFFGRERVRRGMGCDGAVPSGTCLGPTLVLMAQFLVERRHLVERTMQFAIVRILQLKFCSGECRREVAGGYVRLCGVRVQRV